MLSRGDVDVVGVLGDAGDGQGEGSVGVSNDDVRLCCSFVDIVGGMRRQRAGMVQTPLQLRCCIEAATRLLELFSC